MLLADNVGDNVGDIAGMGADLFGSFAEATCAALVISSVSTLGTEHVYVAMCYPLLISAVGILVCLITTLIATDLKPARGITEIESTLKMQLVISTILATPVSGVWLMHDICSQMHVQLHPSLLHSCAPDHIRVTLHVAAPANVTLHVSKSAHARVTLPVAVHAALCDLLVL